MSKYDRFKQFKNKKGCLIYYEFDFVCIFVLIVNEIDERFIAYSWSKLLSCVKRWYLTKIQFAIKQIPADISKGKEYHGFVEI